MIKHLFALAFLSFNFSVLAQDTTYYDSDFEPIPSFDSSGYYNIVSHEEDNEATEKFFYASGSPKSEEHYSNYEYKIPDGKKYEWYPNGQLKAAMNYQDGQLHGSLRTYWQNGQLKRSDSFSLGKPIEGKMFNPDGTPASRHTDYFVPPEFPGGTDQLMRYLGTKIKYRWRFRKKGIKGRVCVLFTVKKDGSVGNVHLTKQLDEEFDREIIKAIQNMPKWKPCLIDGQPSSVKCSLPIRFVR